MSDRPPFKDQDLDDLFALAKDKPLQASDDLMSRVLADAQTIVTVQTAPSGMEQPGWIAALMGMIGGWPAAAGLATAAAAGVMIGVASPDALVAITTSAFGDTSATVFEEILPSYDGFWDEG